MSLWHKEMRQGFFEQERKVWIVFLAKADSEAAGQADAYNRAAKDLELAKKKLSGRTRRALGLLDA